jgi:hypothetical protein
MFKRRKLREVYPGARSAFIEHDGDIEAAKSAVFANPAKYGFDPMTILAILQIVITIWQLWKKRKTTHPPESFDDFEPTCELEDDDNLEPEALADLPCSIDSDDSDDSDE